MNTPHPYDLIIGLDRSDNKADITLIDTRTDQRRNAVIKTSPEALRDWLLTLRQQHPGARLALCLEQPAGHLIPFLEAYDWIYIFAINPITLQKYREAFVTSRAKDDTRDAEFMADLALKHHDQLKLWAPEDSATREIQLLVSHRRAVVDERTELCNRLGSLLKQYFPQALTLCGEDLWRPLAAAFLLKWPTLKAAQTSKPATLKAFYHLHGSRSTNLVQERLALLENAVAVTEEQVVIESFALRVQLICRQLQSLQRGLAQYDQKIAKAYAAHPDRAIYANLPGAGAVLGPRLLGSLGSQRERYESAASLQSYTGVAPVTKRSGGSCYIHRRYRCPRFHRQSFHEYAKESVLWCRWAAAYYLQQRQRGSSHHTAVRALAFKWQRIIWRCWQDRKPYEEQVYEASLLRGGSGLLALFDQVELGKSPWKNRAANR